MCNPTLAVAAASTALQYQQSINAQKAQRDAQTRQNELALKNLQNKRLAIQENLIQRTKKNLKVLSIREKQARSKKAKFLASDRGFSGNTYQFLLNNFENNIGDIRSTIFGNIQFDARQFQNNYSNLNTMYENQSTYVSNVDYGTTALVAGLNYSKSYLDYKNKLSANEVSTPQYSYEELVNTEGGIT